MPSFLSQNGEISMRKITNNRLIVTKIVGEALFIYGLLGWIYGVLIQTIHPCWIEAPLSHLTPWLRLDTFTILSFIVSIAGFFTLRLCQACKARASKVLNS